MGVEELIEYCTPHVLSGQGHAVYLRHPTTHELVLFSFEEDGAVADAKHRALRRVLGGIVRETIAEAFEQ